ncbi:NADH:ubiquinone oxidoreductase [Halopseudomonas aestusnigri]|uniref:NADH:ubiquinone oxidoreductase n=1 Tax=Halopseudomonas aestusnigri TaxID=857252 RepID=A0AAQ1G7E2_9GAMM|nr:NADH:ubiquinone oxidoreductase [Halopseudomonas aestusnigri]OWL88632.1 hypothetical protein B7O88_10720 [Halopseudomonas aestusnigri]SEG39267.1 hypothetical protein SAMN05216586_10657 [Halopseudomonas aestusnigri]
MRRVITLLLCLVSPPLLASACLIESTDDQLPVRMCQQNGTIPPALFEQQFCQPRIPGREFRIQMQDSCPGDAYGVCRGAHTEGVAYQQDIHYYTAPDDAPVLKAYCEQISGGRWDQP